MPQGMKGVGGIGTMDSAMARGVATVAAWMAMTCAAVACWGSAISR